LKAPAGAMKRERTAIETTEASREDLFMTSPFSV